MKKAPDDNDRHAEGNLGDPGDGLEEDGGAGWPSPNNSRTTRCLRSRSRR